MTKRPVFIPRTDRRLGNKYELLECLGDGSFGWVWRAERLEDRQIVAVKIPKQQGAKDEELMEGSALRASEPHPNVIQVYWMGRVPPDKEWYAIEMEYFPSVTLARLLDGGEQGFVASYERILSLYAQVLSGVAHLHRLGTSHGDIKPQNILVADDCVKLTDFGASVLPEELYIRSRENGGTVLYSAPEAVGRILKDENIDALVRADIYSLGVLLYQLLTATLPHDTYSQVARHSPFPRPGEINSTVCPELEAFTMRCLALDPDQRWGSVTEMHEEFEIARATQRIFSPIRTMPTPRQPAADWSSQALRLLDEGNCSEAANVASVDFESSRSPHTFVLWLTAAARDGRPFDCLRAIESNPEMLASDSPVCRDVRRLALDVFIQTRRIDQAEKLLNESLAREGPSLGLLLKKASLLGLQAHYKEASEILLQLNREHPGISAILKRLVLVFEQLRDPGKAAAFLRAYLKVNPGDSWAAQKRHEFASFG